MIFADEELRNADWTKQTADFPHVTTQNQLAILVRGMGLTMDEFRRLPVYLLAENYWDALK